MSLRLAARYLLWAFMLQPVTDAVAQKAPAFSAALRMEIQDSDVRTPPLELQFNLFFDGNNRWRLSPGQDRQSQLRSLETGAAVPSSAGDIFIRDEARHVLYRFLSRPLTPEVLYHEFDAGPLAPRSPEAFGLDDWTLYNPQSPCAGLLGVSCRRAGVRRIGRYACDVWEMRWRDGVHGTSSLRTIWIDRATGITIRSRLIEQPLAPDSAPRQYRATAELSDIRIEPQVASLFELRTKDGVPIMEGSRERAGDSAGSGYIFRAAAKEVLVDVSVRDGRGRPITRLSRSDFRIFEDGAERPLAGFWFDEHPLAIALVVDKSGSMLRNLQEMQQTAEEVLSRLKPVDEVAFFSFDDDVSNVVELTTDRGQISRALGEVTAGGGTDIVNALLAACVYLRNKAPDKRRVVILVSDNLAPPFTVNEAGVMRDEMELIDTALQNEVVIYNLHVSRVDRSKVAMTSLVRRGALKGLRQEWAGDPVAMERITETTGGAMMKAPRARRMLDEVVSELRRKYVISFVPARPHVDGRMRTIEVRLGNRWNAMTYTVHHRTGYRTPQVAAAR